MGSTRFPGKMLARLGDHALLEWVLLRLGRASRLDETILATTTLPRDDALVGLAAQCGVRTYRGAEADVLGRFCAAAEMAAADRVVRICADNPFVDPGEVDRLVEFFAQHDADYACNHLDRLGSRYADGFGGEILSATLLRDLAASATESRHREHVTLYLWDQEAHYRMLAVPAPPELAHPKLRFDVDRPADLVRLAKCVDSGLGINAAAREFVERALQVPEFLVGNSN